MIDAIAGALADPAGRSLYLAFCFLLQIVPMIASALWYRARNIRTSGGRVAMTEHAAGCYGEDVRRIQSATYALVTVWLIVNLIIWGMLFPTDEANRP